MLAFGRRLSLLRGTILLNHGNAKQIQYLHLLIAAACSGLLQSVFREEHYIFTFMDKA